ncbi:hypothetical protein DFA_07403 [Cavenderia fasciculata]|uniref:Uncharacterized protein n=1 Tax=Cavenderia fasciculata TaxID=261658 RepID=F4PWB6_CACFS|nr:uncharacterized protein DFA_07403 [Cavenderia fasciculata]EGG20280.1 hypothetical protein DFA_07403 [Cavenderia fasciculata]|eukprot:XP_004367263.1 hypothetical protein DFA_07403 [Cavenderia fasciculata]
MFGIKAFRFGRKGSHASTSTGGNSSNNSSEISGSKSAYYGYPGFDHFILLLTHLINLLE